MKVKAVKAYYDLELKRQIEAGEEFEVTAARGKTLTTANNKAGHVLCEEVAAPKKPKAKKED